MGENVYSFSKSRYCSAVQCPKILWLKKNRPELFDESVMNQSTLSTGNEVGDLAMGLFGPYKEVPFGDMTEMIAETANLMKDKTPVICEASFSSDGCFCSVDILRLRGSLYDIYEVKSSTELKDIYIDDVSYQYHVLKRCGVDVGKVHLVHINNQYVRHGELELDKLFSIVDLTLEAKKKQGEVEQRISSLRDYMRQAEEPSVKCGEQCSNPYACGFVSHCRGELPSPNIFDISGRFDRRMDLYHQGVVSFGDLMKIGGLSWKQMLQVSHELENRDPYIDAEAIRVFMKEFSYPLYFLDFETFQPAIPLFDDSRPYQQIPFQYSLHWIEKEGGELHHSEFLAHPGKDPRRLLAEELCKDIPEGVCTVAYHMAFEKSRLKELAELYPDLSTHLMNIHDNMHDLIVPFRKGWYYTKAMAGSYSIKYVLPALFPDDPELDYQNLEGIHNGGEASETYLAMWNMTQEEIEKNRQNLLKYCGLDTYAMVKIWEKLNMYYDLSCNQIGEKNEH